MLNFPYEQRIWILSGLPQITKFTINRFFAKHHLQFFVFLTFIMGIGYQNIGWFYIHMYNSFAVQVWLSQKPKTRNKFLGFLFIASRALLQRYSHCNRPLRKNFLTCYSRSYHSFMVWHSTNYIWCNYVSNTMKTVKAILFVHIRQKLI